MSKLFCSNLVFNMSLVFLYAACSIATANDAIDYSQWEVKDLRPEHFDHQSLLGNGNKTIEIDEFARFHLRKQNPPINKLDKNKDYQVSWDEILIWVELFTYDLPDGRKSFTYEEVASTLKPVESKSIEIGDSETGLGQMRLRSKYKDLAKKMAKSDPASFGYFYDNNDDESTWAVEGTFGIVRTIYSPKETIELGNYTFDPVKFIPALTVNRVTGTGGGTVKEVDAMVFRAGLAWGAVNNKKKEGSALFDYQLFSLNYRATGETSGGNFDNAMEFYWEPQRNRVGELISLNGPYRAFSSDKDIDPQKELFLYRLALGGKLELGEAPDESEEDDSESAETDDSTFVKLGPTIGLYVKPNFIPRLELFANYSYFWEIANDSDNFDYLETGVRFALDDFKQVFVEMKYRDGQLPAKYTDIDLWQISLSTRF